MPIDPWAAFRVSSPEPAAPTAPSSASDPWASFRVATPAAQPAPQSFYDNIGKEPWYAADRDLITGVAKGVGNTITGLGEMAGSIPMTARPGALGEGVDALVGQPGASEAGFAAARAATVPSNARERRAMVGEQMAEFVALPGTAGLRGAARFVQGAAPAAVLARAQGSSNTGAVVAGALGGLPVAEGVMWAGKKIGDAAAPLVRAAIKPTVSAMKRVAGASVSGIEAQANKLVNFILENKITTADKARTIVTEAERELQRILAVKNAPTDAPQRALRYLESLERQAAKQALPAADVAVLRNAAAEVLESGLGKDVLKMVPRAHPTLTGPSGQPLMVLTPETSRVLRTDVRATEALERARATSRWDTRKAYGEQKGAQMEASKAIERGLRDSVKASTKEAAPVLQRQGLGIRAADVLDRAEFRAANRDAASMPGQIVAGTEVALGQVPVMGFAANWLRNNQLKAGMWADDLGKAINNGDVGRVVSILHRLGVGATAQADTSER